MKALPSNPTLLAAALRAQSGDRKAAVWLERQLAAEAARANPHGLPAELLEAEQQATAQDGILIGQTLQQRPVTITLRELTMHATIQARSGGGKTNLAKLLALQLAQRGIGIIIIDRKFEYDVPHFQTATWSQLRDNPWAPPPGVPTTIWLQVICQLFCNSFYLLSAVHPLYQLASKLWHADGSLTTLMLLQALERHPRKGTFREQELRTQTAHRLATLVEAFHGVRQREALDVQRAASTHLILHADFAIPEISTFAASLLIARLLLWRIHAGATSNLQTVILCDEAKAIFSTARETQTAQYGAPILADLVSQSRAFGVGIIAIDQLTLPAYLTQNAGTRILLSCTATTERTHPINLLSTEVRNWFSANAQPGHALVCTPDNPRARFVVVPLLALPPSLVTEPAPEWLISKNESPSIDASPPLPKEAAPTPSPGTHDLSAIELRLLLEIVFTAFSTTTELYKKLELAAETGKRLIDGLERQGLLQRHSIQLSARGRPSTILEATEKALLRFQAKPPKGRGSYEHKAWQHLIAQHYKQDGYSVSIECATPHAVDVVAKKEAECIAIEIELSGENLERNIEGLLKASFRQIIVVCHKAKQAGMKKRIQAMTLPADMSIAVRLLQEFSREGAGS